MSGLIGADELEKAVRAHLDRTALHGPRPINRIIASLQVDAEEFQAMAQTLRDHRQPPDEPSWSAGFIDGFVIGIRAQRALTEKGEE